MGGMDAFAPVIVIGIVVGKGGAFAGTVYRPVFKHHGGEGIPARQGHRTIDMVHPSLVDPLGYGESEHSRARSLQVGIGSVQHIVPESCPILQFCKASDHGAVQMHQLLAPGMILRQQIQ